MKMLVTTGGTGGHIYPAVALASYMLKKDKQLDIKFIGNSDRMENTIIPQMGYSFIGIEAARFNDNGNKLKALSLLYKSYKECLSIVKEYGPDIVIGFGGYVTVPVLMAAHKLGIKTVIHEQNSIAGLANRTLGHFVDKVVTVYPGVGEAFPDRKVVNLGNPRESAALDFNKDRQIFKEYGLNPAKKTILIVMGSLGSASVNEKMVQILNELKNKPYNIIYVTGKNNYGEFAGKVEETDTLKILPYIDQFNVAGNCDLVVSRGGATSACEYMALGVPSIIIPSPYVPNNHQFLNAKSMLDNGACKLLEEKDLTSEKLTDMIEDLVGDDIKLRQMSEAARKMSHVHAAEDISELLYEMVGK
ncbi:MAG: undecaprenyldiphospho-muramoylpentapeptide beta-N-acetylglucosaminyltransferase [Erysipelotrichaceae bacterium]|nr:undecaprenyldiphospho-muramoylpentapeptide beta-N-acetylglucosaminyltransferase [Erysipelotrichaceae bacterium]